MAYKWNNTWIKVPAVGINGGILKSFTAATIGASIAALKIYIALLEQTNNDSSSQMYGISSPSITALELMTGLSRALVVSGTSLLERHNLIKVRREIGRENIYTIAGYDVNPWGKLP